MPYHFILAFLQSIFLRPTVRLNDMKTYKDRLIDEQKTNTICFYFDLLN